ncbi:hypothetical protein VTO42DRAFT_2522 [Malbranchea cinnamomea]
MYFPAVLRTLYYIVHIDRPAPPETEGGSTQTRVKKGKEYGVPDQGTSRIPSPRSRCVPYLCHSECSSSRFKPLLACWDLGLGPDRWAHLRPRVTFRC